MLNKIPPPFALSASNSSVSRGTVAFSNSNNISFGLNGSTITASASYSNSSLSVSDAATSGTLARLAFTNLNGLTLSLSTGAGGSHTIVGSHNALTSQSNQNVTAANGGFAFQTLSFSNANGISFGTSAGSAITGSHNAITTARASTDAIGLNTAKTNVTWTVNSSGLSLDAGGYAGTGFTSTTTAGTAIVGTHNTAGLSLGVPVYLTTTPAQLSVGVSTGGNTAGDTGVFTGRVVFAGGNNITLSGSSNGGNVTYTISAPNLGAGAFSGGASNLGNTAGSTGVTGTRLALVGTGVVSLSQATDASGGTLSIAVPATSSLSATGIVSISTNGSTISIGASQSNQTGNLYASSNTFGTSSGTYDARSLSIAGSGAVNVAASNSGWVISAPTQTNQTGNVYAVGNTYGTSSGTFDARTVSLSARTDGIISVAASNSGWELSSPPPVSQYDPFANAPVTNSTMGQSSLFFVPFDVPYPISASRINFFLSLTHTYSGAPANSTAWLAAGYGIYTRMSGTGSDRISLLTSYSLSYMSGSVSSSTRLSMTNYMGLSNATSHSTTQYGVNNATASNFLINSYAGFRVLALPLNVTLQPGRSWLGFSVQSASQGGSFVLAANVVQQQYSNQIAYRPFNVSSAASNASFYDASNGFGTYSAQSAAWPNSIPLTSDSIRIAPVGTFPAFNFSGISTSTNIL